MENEAFIIENITISWSVPSCLFPLFGYLSCFKSDYQQYDLKHQLILYFPFRYSIGNIVNSSDYSQLGLALIQALALPFFSKGHPGSSSRSSSPSPSTCSAGTLSLECSVRCWVPNLQQMGSLLKFCDNKPYIYLTPEICMRYA